MRVLTDILTDGGVVAAESRDALTRVTTLR